MPISVVSQGPWRVGSLRWQPRPGAFALTVTCCATFNLAPDESPLVSAAAETALFEGDERALVEPWGPIAPWKHQAEVILVGRAYAPEGVPVRTLVPSITVGGVEKAIQIRGDSWWIADGSVTEPSPFAHMPLRWERAAGGRGTDNPAGVPVGADAVADRWGRIPVPNLLPFGAVISASNAPIEPASFGPLRPDWPSRLARFRDHAGTWDPLQWMERPLPEDLDPACFNVAPRDQTVEQLTRHERIVLSHLHPRHPHLVTHLRSPAPRASTRITGIEQSVALRCDTLVIDTDRGKAVLVWRGQLAIDHPQSDGVVLISAGKRASTSPGTITAAAAPISTAAELPFRLGRQVTLALPPETANQPVARALPFTPQPSGDANDTLVPAFTARRTDLPFRPSSPPAPPVPEWTPRPSEAPPPMLGPLAHTALAAPESAPPVAAPEPEPEPALAPPVEETPPAGPPIKEFPLARTAAMAARIDRQPAKYSQILEHESLAPIAWEALEEHWRAAVDADMALGRRKTLAAYDEAYVGALEADRGPITAAEYARLLIASERGGADGVLEELGLPAQAMMRLRRVWLGRTVRDPRAAEALRLAMRVASEG